MTITLYGSQISTFARKVAVALDLKELTFEHVDGLTPQMRDKLREANPRLEVPVLFDGEPKRGSKPNRFRFSGSPCRSGRVATLADRGRPRLLRKPVSLKRLPRAAEPLSQLGTRFCGASAVRRPEARAADRIHGRQLDTVLRMLPGVDMVEAMRTQCADRRYVKVIEGAGHWLQEERPAEVNTALLEFLSSICD